MPPRRRIVTVAFEDVQALDVTGPTEVFSLADRAAPGGAYRLELHTADGRELHTSSGLRLVPDRRLADQRGAIDTLLVAGGLGISAAARDRSLIDWLRSAATRARRVASICTGAFLLAEAGLLDGRRATTHWAACETLAHHYPQVAVDPDPIFIRDGNVYTSAGVSAGIDLALALVEEDLGARATLEVARALVLFARRPGSQAQFSAAMPAHVADRAPIRELQDWIGTHLDGDLSVPALAERCFMSPRHFARVFAREVGATPGAYVESVRLERARLLLETTDVAITGLAARCGFGTVETFRRTFARRLGVSPSDYRTRFGVA